MSNSRSSQWRRARSELELSHEQLDCAPGESGFDSVSYEGAHTFAVEGCLVNDVDSVELEAISDLECDSVGWRWSNSSSDSDSDEEITDVRSDELLEQNLAEWSVKCNVTHSAVGALLKVLKPYHPSLPLDPRTLLKTPSNYSIKQIEGGEYCHIGIGKGLQYLIGTSALSIDNLELQINVDGLPLFRSSSMSLWPILCLVRNIDFKEPAVIGLFCGKEKPGNASEFLSDFISDMLTVMEKGLCINEKMYSIAIHSFVCDAPARAFLKGIKSHSGYSSCEKCTVYGEYDGKVCFSSTSSSLRTDDSFDKMLDENHHVDASCPLSPLRVGCVSQFGLDYMHLVCLGVMRRLLLYWKGPVGPLHVRLGRKSVLELSQRLVLCAAYCPLEFARKPRTLDEVNRWKATEFREFLLYSGPLVLREVLSDELFSHFMLLFVGMRILASRQLAVQYCDYANELLVKFVTDAEILYGRQIMVYNVHCLIHLAADVKRLGCLDDFSAFPFENKLGQLKKLVRKPNQPMQQILRRIDEQQSFQCTGSTSVVKPVTKFEHNAGPLVVANPGARQFKQLLTNQWSLSLKLGNSCIMTTDGCPAFVKNIVVVKEDITLVCTKFESVIDAFSYPLPSSKLSICQVERESTFLFTITLSDVLCKCVCLPVFTNKDSFFIIPYLH